MPLNDFLILGILVVLALLLMCRLNITVRITSEGFGMEGFGMEGFGMDNRPFEPENTLLHMNPWDNVDYQVPVFTRSI